MGIDARLYGTKHRGLGRYVQKLVDGLVKADRANNYVVFLTKENFDGFTTDNPRVKKVLFDARWYSLKEQLIGPGVIKKAKLDLIHFPHFNVPFFLDKKYIVTIHDLIINHFPDSRATTLPNWKYKLKLLAYRIILKRAINRASKIIVPTNFVKNDILRFYRVDESKIRVINEGYFLAEGIKPADISRFRITKPCLLYVGAAYPHKNLDRLTRVFRELNKSGKYQLVLVGYLDFFYKRLRRTVKDCQDIIFTGYVSEAELIGLYGQALIYVFPSLHEGFGLPAIEAQANGLAVASSNASCLPEVLADSAVYFNPDDEEEMLKKIGQLIEDKELREVLTGKGRENIKRFSWEKNVKETHSLYLF